MTKLVKRKKADLGELTEEIQQTLARYLLDIRKEFETNDEAKNTVISSDPAIDAKPKLLELFAHKCKPGTEKLFEEAIEIALNELDGFRKNPASLYLIDNATGKAVMPITDDLIYTPPDYVGEDGKLHKAKPIIHPGISSSLTLAVYGKAKLERHLKKIKDPITEQAYKHLHGPEQILEMAKERLVHNGISISDDSTKCDKIIEFGREQAEGVMQSPNIHFHRAHMYAAVLAHKIMKLGGQSAEYFVGAIENKKNSKQSWYVVQVGYELKSI